MGFSPMLKHLLLYNPRGSIDLVQRHMSAEGGPLIDIQATTEAFLSPCPIQKLTAFLL